MTVSNIPRRAVLVRLITPAEQRRQVHLYPMLSGDSVEDAAAPGYFDSLAPKLHRYDRIEVVSDDNNVFAEFLVVEASSMGVRVMLMRSGEFGSLSQAGAPGAAIRRPTELHVEERGAYLRWCVLRGDKILKDKFQSESAATLWLNEHAKTTSMGGHAA